MIFGNSWYGAYSTRDLQTDPIQEASHAAFAAIRADGCVVTWGSVPGLLLRKWGLQKLGDPSRPCTKDHSMFWSIVGLLIFENCQLS